MDHPKHGWRSASHHKGSSTTANGPMPRRHQRLRSFLAATGTVPPNVTWSEPARDRLEAIVGDFVARAGLHASTLPGRQVGLAQVAAGVYAALPTDVHAGIATTMATAVAPAPPTIV